MVKLLHLDSETNCPRIFPVQCGKWQMEVCREKLRELGQLLLSYCVCHWPQAERLGEPISSDCTHSLKMFQMLQAVLNKPKPTYCSEMSFIRFVVLNVCKATTSLVVSVTAVSKKKKKNRKTGDAAFFPIFHASVFAQVWTDQTKDVEVFRLVCLVEVPNDCM